MTFKMSFDGKLYRNTGTYSSPTWNEIPNVGTVTHKSERDKVDVPLRADGKFKGFVPGRQEDSFEFSMPHDMADTDLVALQTAYDAGTAIDFAVMDGAIASAGSTGIRGTFFISKFPRSEEIDKHMDHQIELVYMAGSGHPPERLTIT